VLGGAVPIQTNLAQCIHLHHVPLPGDAADATALNAAFEREGLRRGRLEAVPGNGGILLVIRVPLPLEALGDDFWREVGKLVARTGEPWWDFCATIVDHEPLPAHPLAHALSLYRVTMDRKLAYLHHEEF
jgi:hypothetical protein